LNQNHAYHKLLNAPRKDEQTEVKVAGWKRDDKIVAVLVVASREQWGKFSDTLVCIR